MLGFTHVEEATSQASNTVDQVWRDEPLHDLEGLFSSLNGGEGEAEATYATSSAVAGKVSGVNEGWMKRNDWDQGVLKITDSLKEGRGEEMTGGGIVQELKKSWRMMCWM